MAHQSEPRLFVRMFDIRILSSNRSHIVKLPATRVGQCSLSLPVAVHMDSVAALVLENIADDVEVKCCAYTASLFSLLAARQQLSFMHTPHQFLLISSPPTKEARFQTARKLYGSTFAFQ